METWSGESASRPARCRMPAFLAILAFSLAAAACTECLAGSKELLDRIAPLIPSKSEFPAGWEISDEIPDDNPQMRRLRDFIEPMVVNYPGCFAYRTMGVKTGGYTYVFCSVSFKDETTLREFKLVLKERSRIYHFSLGLFIFTVWPSYDLVGMTIEDLVSSKYAAPILQEIEKCADSGIQDKAWDILENLTDEIEISARVSLRAAEICLHRMKPPRIAEARAFLEEAVLISAKVPLPREQLFAAYKSLAQIHLMNGDRTKAHEWLEKAMNSAGGTDMESELKLLAEFAKLDASLGNAEECLKTIEKAVRLEAGLGDNTILHAARNDSAFSLVHGDKRFADLVKKYGSLDKFVSHLDPGRPKISLPRTPIFIWPPAVFLGGKRDAAEETSLEDSLLKKCEKQSVAFGRKREVLPGEGKDDCSRLLCGHSSRAVVWEATFDLKAYKGDSEKVVDYAKRMAEIARSFGVSKFVPSICLAVWIDTEDAGGTAVIRVKAVLCDVSVNRIHVLLVAKKQVPVADLRKTLAALPSEIFRMMESAMRKTG